MNHQFPGAVGPFDPSDARGFQQGQAGTHPGLPPKYAVPAVWDGPKAAMVWAAGTSPVIRTTTWRSPIFDLRPYLRSGTGARANQRAVPIWLPGGAAGKLFIKVGGLQSQTYALTGLRVLATELADPAAEQDIAVFGDPQDVTTKFSANAPTALLDAIAPGEGYPVRYWQITLTFDFLIDNTALGPDPGLWVKASYY